MSEPPSITISDSISAIFTSHLPTVPSTLSVGDEFARGLLDYLAAFKTQRDAAGMNYEASPEYQNAQFTLMRVPTTQFWPYSPHFKKCLALTLQTLFKTEILLLSSTLATMEQVCVFVDKDAFRWIVVIEEDAIQTDMNRVYLFFPRARTLTSNMMSTDTAPKLLANTSLATKAIVIVTTDITHWTAGT